MFKRLLILVIFLLLNINFSHSDTKIWKWTDKDGGVHFTDDVRNVPLEYRNKPEMLPVYTPPASKYRPEENIPPTPSNQKKTVKKESPKFDLSILKELKNHIEKEVERDNKIIKMVNNRIANKKISKFLKRDLSTKTKLFNKLKGTQNLKMDKEIEWLLENIEMENKILTNLYTHSSLKLRKAKSLIKQVIKEKMNLLNALETKIND